MRRNTCGTLVYVRLDKDEENKAGMDVLREELRKHGPSYAEMVEQVGKVRGESG